MSWKSGRSKLMRGWDKSRLSRETPPLQHRSSTYCCRCCEGSTARNAHCKRRRRRCEPKVGLFLEWALLNFDTRVLDHLAFSGNVGGDDRRELLRRAAYDFRARD